MNCSISHGVVLPLIPGLFRLEALTFASLGLTFPFYKFLPLSAHQLKLLFEQIKRFNFHSSLLFQGLAPIYLDQHLDA